MTCDWCYKPIYFNAYTIDPHFRDNEFKNLRHSRPYPVICLKCFNEYEKRRNEWINKRGV